MCDEHADQVAAGELTSDGVHVLGRPDAGVNQHRRATVQQPGVVARACQGSRVVGKDVVDHEVTAGAWEGIVVPGPGNQEEY
jgi:hypothetical protein